jgi:hypothetical protein
MIELRMARLAPLRPTPSLTAPAQDTTALAFRYLSLFRRIVVGLAAAGAAVGLLQQWPGLLAACICIGIGEWLECSYYLAVLRWRQERAAVTGLADAPPATTGSAGACGSSHAITSSSAAVSSTPTKTI